VSVGVGPETVGGPLEGRRLSCRCIARRAALPRPVRTCPAASKSETSSAAPTLALGDLLNVAFTPFTWACLMPWRGESRSREVVQAGTAHSAEGEHAFRSKPNTGSMQAEHHRSEATRLLV
jgi:hypothetical protein